MELGSANGNEDHTGECAVDFFIVLYRLVGEEVLSEQSDLCL